MKGLIFISVIAISASACASENNPKDQNKKSDRVLTKEELVNKKKLYELEHKKAKGNPPIYHKVEERKTKESRPD